MQTFLHYWEYTILLPVLFLVVSLVLRFTIYEQDTARRKKSYELFWNLQVGFIIFWGIATLFVLALVIYFKATYKA